MTVLDTRIPAGLDSDGMTPDERRQFETLRAHRALGLLIQRVPVRYTMWRWSICAGVHGVTDRSIGVEVTLGSTTGHDARATLMGLAEQFGLDYAEKPHGNGDNIVTATGFYAGAPVRFLKLVEPCACGCEGVR